MQNCGTLQLKQFTSVTLDPCLAAAGSVRKRVRSPELTPFSAILESRYIAVDLFLVLTIALLAFVYDH
jgi:hypothetical protein